MERQLTLLKPVADESPKVGRIPTAVDLPTGFFDFAGFVNKERRKGQFQYRFGRKVQPVDRAFFLAIAISASALTAVAQLDTNKESRLNPDLNLGSHNAIDRVADAIFRVEHSKNHPYGVMLTTKNPRAVCENTIRHAWVCFNERARLSTDNMKRLANVDTIGRLDKSAQACNRECTPLSLAPTSLEFIDFLGKRYCPPSVDPVGFQHWTNNMARILHAK